MATRSLTEVFVLLRNNCLQSRHTTSMFADPSGSRGEDRMHLVPLERDVEVGIVSGNSNFSRVPPEWIHFVDEFQYELSKVKSRLKDLRELQNHHLNRPAFDDQETAGEQMQIKKTAEEITSSLAHCQRLIQKVAQTGGDRDEKLRANVVQALLGIFQEITQEFREVQTGYLKQLQKRESEYNQYFAGSSAAFSAEGPSTSPMIDFDQIDIPALERGEPPTMAQLQMIEDSTKIVEIRELEILEITKSIVELNQLFRDVAQMVVDQGTVIDRIDYNIEQSSVRVKAALHSVQKAEKYQRKNRKILVIIGLSCAIAFFLILLIIRLGTK